MRGADRGASLLSGRLLCSVLATRVGVSLEVQLPSPPIGYVRVELCRRQIGMSEHFLNRSQVGAAFEEVRREGVAQEVRMDAFRLEPCLVRQAAEDEEYALAGERPAARVEEQLGAVALVEEGPAPREIAPERLRRLASHRYHTLLAPLAKTADEPVFEIDGLAVERDGLADAQPGAVEQLAESLVAEGARRRPGGGIEEPLDLGGRERARQRPAALGKLDVGRGIVGSRAE